MAFNENVFAAEAAKKLLVQLQSDDSSYSRFSASSFYEALLCNSIRDLRVHQILSGKDKGKLTLERRVQGGGWEIYPGITPVDCYNRPIKDLSTAVQSYYGIR